MRLTPCAVSEATLAEAVQRLQRGGLVGMPTETVYGLAADADQADAVGRIFAAKGRPHDHPLIVHVAPLEAHRASAYAPVLHFADHIPPWAARLIDAFWPGPLTLILPRRAGVATAAAGGQSTVGVRCPAHPVAQALLRACAAAGIAGLAAPSANRFGRISPTTATHVADEFSDHLTADELLILDGGACSVGIESTIVDASRAVPVLLRPGMLTVAELEQAAGLAFGHREADAPRVSGSLESHYAPRARLRLMTARELQAALDVLGPDARHLAVFHRSPLRISSPHVRTLRMADDAHAAAHTLFAALRTLDTPDTRLIWVEQPPDGPLWAGVLDRLSRAAA